MNFKPGSTQAHTHKQMPGQVSTRRLICGVLTAILQAEGLQGRCYRTGHAGDAFAGLFQVIFHNLARMGISKL